MFAPEPADAAGPAGPFVSRHRIGAFRLLWTGTIALPLIVLALGALAVWNGVVRNQTGVMLRTLDMVNEQTLRVLETQNAALAALEGHIDAWSWDQIGADPALYSFLRRLVAAAPSVVQIGIIAPDGRVVANSNAAGPLAGPPRSERSFVRAFPPGSATTRAYVSEVVASSSTGRFTVHVARARHGPDGRGDGGVLTAAFAPSYFERLFAGVAETPATGLILARDDGAILARHPIQVAAVGEHLPATDPVMRAARAARPGGTAEMVRGGSLVGGFELLAVRHVADYPLFIAYRADPTEIRNTWLRQIVPFALTALISMLLLMLLTARVQRRLGAERALMAQRAVTAEQGQAAAQTRAELEARLRQTEKIAALGQLSAGVAHDINNMLQSIVISAESLDRPDVSPAEARDIGTIILRVCDRGAALTRRMLDYARRDDRPGGDTDVAGALRSLSELLERSLAPKYGLRLDLRAVEDLWAKGHPAEFETVIINLVVNARDAMPDGGTIGIDVQGIEETETPTDSRLPPGRYVRVRVSDAGQGMDPTVLAQAGEAFFTTKPRGQGTGLGLSMARGFARRSGGKLDLDSTPGKGTTVTLWLPAA